MESTKINDRLLLCLLTFLSLIFLLPSSGMTLPPKGEVVFATQHGTFYQIGGDPATLAGGYSAVARTVFDGLVTTDIKRTRYLPALAKSWKIAPDGKYIDFLLREDVTFHNGDKFTAEDVKFSIETYLRKELKFVLGGFKIKNNLRADVLGPYRVRLHMDSPDPLLLQHLWWGMGILPKKYREQVGDKGFAEKPVGTGPYRWLEYKQDAYWKAEAVKKHFRQTPAIKTFKMAYVPDHTTRLAMLKAGEADIAEINPPNVPDVQSDKSLRLVLDRYTHLSVLTYADLDRPEPSPLKDIRVREAVSLAIDREGITKRVLFGMAEPYGDWCSPITLGHDPNVKPDPYDPQKAKKILAEAGYPNGFETVLTTIPINKFWMEAIAANLNEAGIKANIEVMEPGPYVQKIIGRNLKGIIFQMLWYGPSKSASGDAIAHWMSGNTFAYNTTPEIEKEILRGNAAHTDKEMQEAGKRLSNLMRKTRIKTFLWANHMPYALGPRIEYWEPEVAALPPCAFEFIRLKQQYQ